MDSRGRSATVRKWSASRGTAELIVYVETNFVLELAYLRRTSDDCQRLLDLSPQDAVVYATVLDHATRNEGNKVFVTQNANDFRVPQIEEELAIHGCKLLIAFDAAVAYIRKHL